MAMRQPKILVVDDDPCFLGFLVALLRGASFEPIEAGDAKAAIVAVGRSRPDAAILDVALPGVSGYGLCRELREVLGAEIPVLFVSGSRVDAIDRAAGLLVGGDDYLVKPIDPDELLARLRRLIERARSWTKPATSGLSGREIEVLQLLAEGLPPTRVAARLVISPKTVSSHVQRILSKLDVHTRAQAVAVAYESGVIRFSANGGDVQAHADGKISPVLTSP